MINKGTELTEERRVGLGKLQHYTYDEVDVGYLDWWVIHWCLYIENGTVPSASSGQQ